MVKEVLDNCESRMAKCVSALEGEYLTMRTGRASAALFDKIKVDYYGTETPLNQVASISSPEARLIVIQPWDKSVLGAIEKAIQKMTDSNIDRIAKAAEAKEKEIMEI